MRVERELAKVTEEEQQSEVQKPDQLPYSENSWDYSIVVWQKLRRLL